MQHMQPRTLSGAHRYFLNGEEMENAHDAAADVHATVRVLNALVTHFPSVVAMSGDELSAMAK